MFQTHVTKATYRSLVSLFGPVTPYGFTVLQRQLLHDVMRRRATKLARFS